MKLVQHNCLAAMVILGLLANVYLYAQEGANTYRLIAGRLYDFRPAMLAGTDNNPYYIRGQALDKPSGGALPLRRLVGTHREFDTAGLNEAILSAGPEDQLRMLYVMQLAQRKKPLGFGEFNSLGPEARSLYLQFTRTVLDTEDIVLLNYPLPAARGTEVRAFAIPYIKTNSFAVWDFGLPAPPGAVTNFTELARVYTNGVHIEKLKVVRQPAPLPF